MYVGTLAPVSNRADWNSTFELKDDETDALVDLSAAIIVFDVKDKETCTVVLSATTTNGKITIPSTGVFQVDFTETEMSGLCANTYDVGCTVEIAGVTSQLVIGQLYVLDGVVP